MRKIFSFSLLLFINSCSITALEDEYLYYQWAGVNKIQFLSKERGQLKLKVDLTVPTPCNEFHTRESSQIGDTVYVMYYSKVKKGIPCILILGNIVIYDVFNLEPGKSYFFRFHKEEGNYLDTLIQIN